MSYAELRSSKTGLLSHGHYFGGQMNQILKIKRIALCAAVLVALGGVTPKVVQAKAPTASNSSTTYDTKVTYDEKVVGKNTYYVVTTTVTKRTRTTSDTKGKVAKKSTSTKVTKTSKKVNVTTKVNTTKSVTTIIAPIKTTTDTTVVTSTIVSTRRKSMTVKLNPGCKFGWTSHYDLSDSRIAARCDSNFPAAKPLSTTETINVAAGKTEFWAPISAAINLGEFAKENLNIRLVTLSQSADAMQQLDNGSLDVSMGGIEQTLFSAAQKSLNVKLVMGNYTPPNANDLTQPQSGIWCRRDYFSNPANPQLTDFKKGASFAVVGSGKGAVSTYWATTEIRRRYPKFDPAKMTYTGMAANLTLTALQNKAVNCALLLDPYWTTAASNADLVLVATQPPAQPFGGYFFGKRLLIDRPDLGDAFARALIRTINTYFAGDYHKNPTTMNEIARWVPNYNTALNATYPSLIFDWEIRSGTTTRIQKLFKDLKIIDYSPIPDAKLVDRGYYERAVGKIR